MFKMRMGGKMAAASRSPQAGRTATAAMARRRLACRAQPPRPRAATPPAAACRTKPDPASRAAAPRQACRSLLDPAKGSHSQVRCTSASIPPAATIVHSCMCNCLLSHPSACCIDSSGRRMRGPVVRALCRLLRLKACDGCCDGRADVAVLARNGSSFASLTHISNHT